VARVDAFEGELPNRAMAWIARWEAIGDAEGRPHDQAFWQAGREWIAAQRRYAIRPGMPSQTRGPRT
jgi:hypothetical protein